MPSAERFKEPGQNLHELEELLRVGMLEDGAKERLVDDVTDAQLNAFKTTTFPKKTFFRCNLRRCKKHGGKGLFPGADSQYPQVPHELSRFLAVSGSLSAASNCIDGNFQLGKRTFWAESFSEGIIQPLAF